MKRQQCKKYLKIYNYKVKDQLEHIFKMQSSFASRFHSLNLSSKEKDQLTNTYLIALSQEIAELREEIRWKPWKQYPDNFKHDEVEIKFEIADLLCFLIDIALVWGMSAEELFNYYISKYELNEKRQTNKKFGYIIK